MSAKSVSERCNSRNSPLHSWQERWGASFVRPFQCLSLFSSVLDRLRREHFGLKMQPVVNGTPLVVTGRVSPSGSESPLVARTGRHKQRYENGVRLLAGCIPYRIVSKVGADGKSQDIIEVLLITSQHGKALLFPKGGWEIDETMEEAALREAMEEAGVRGVLGEALGAYDFKSKRKEQEDGNWTQLDCKAYVYPLLVTEEMETWPEQDSRSRQWCPLTEAITKLRHDWMQQALLKWGAMLGPSVFPM